MAARSGGIALFGLLIVGMVLGSRVLSSPGATLGFVATDNKVLYAALVGAFAIAAIVAMGSGSGVLRAAGSIVLLGCFSFAMMLWSTWNAPPGLADAVDMLDNIDEQFAEVAAALEGVEANLGAPPGGPVVPIYNAQPTIDGLVASGHVLVGRRCELDAFASGREHLAYLSEEGELVRLIIEVVRSERLVVLGQSSTVGETPLLPIEPACV